MNVCVYVYFAQCMGAALRDDAGQKVWLVSIRPGKGSAVCVCQPSCLFKTITITARKDRILVLTYIYVPAASVSAAGTAFKTCFDPVDSFTSGIKV